MQVTTPSFPGLTLQPLTAARPLVEAWSVGQLLQATVVAPVQPHRVTLLIGGSRLEAQTNSPLRPGQQLTLRVEQRGETALLRVVPQSPPSGEVQARALRSALPRQTPLPPLVANLSLLAKAPEQVPHESAPGWAKLARAMIRALPEPQSLSTPEGLRRAMNNSGVFFESRAARAAGGHAPFPVDDFKAGLLRLAGVLSGKAALPGTVRSPGGKVAPPAPQTQTAPAPSTRANSSGPPQPGTVRDGPEPSSPTPPRADRSAVPVQSSAPPPKVGPPQPQPAASANLISLDPPGRIAAELRNQVEGGLSRVQLHQLNSLAGDDGTKPVWSMEIPVRRGEQVDVWSLRLEQDAANPTSAQEDRWCISVAVEL